MGFISKLFGKENNEVSSSITDDIINQFIELFKEKTIRETITIKLNTNKVKITDSKFGGIGYIPKDKEVPTNQKNEQYRLLAQIRMDDLPHNHIGLPEVGMLQFWVLDDDMTGLEGDYEVIYYPTIDETITSEDIEKKYISLEKESYFPMSDEFGLTFDLENQSMSIEDYQFDQAFINLWNSEYPNKIIKSYYDDLDKKYTDILFDIMSGTGHRIGGYPYFTQYDPRESDMNDYQILLLQIDTDSIDDKEIMWGDCGVGNFFITVADLKNLDFSKIFYTWDCC